MDSHRPERGIRSEHEFGHQNRINNSQCMTTQSPNHCIHPRADPMETDMMRASVPREEWSEKGRDQGCCGRGQSGDNRSRQQAHNRVNSPRFIWPDVARCCRTLCPSSNGLVRCHLIPTSSAPDSHFWEPEHNSLAPDE